MTAVIKNGIAPVLCAVAICSQLTSCTSVDAFPGPHVDFCLEVRRSVGRQQWEELLMPLRTANNLKSVGGPSMGQYEEFTVVWMHFFRGLYFLPAARKNFLLLNNVVDSAYYRVRMRLGNDEAATAKMKQKFIRVVRDEISSNAAEVDLDYCTVRGWEDTLEKMASVIEEDEYTDEDFNGLAAGLTKSEVLKQLKSMGITSVRPDLKDRITVTSADQLDSLRTAEGIIVGAGSVSIEFEHDNVLSIFVAPIYPEWKEILHGAQSRDQVFDALRLMLAGSQGDILIRAVAPDAKAVALNALGEKEMTVLKKFDLWRTSYSDEEGYWALRLYFEDELLQKTAVWYSPIEQP